MFFFINHRFTKGVKVNPYKVMRGPEGFLPPAAALAGNILPEPGFGHIEGKIVNEDQAVEEAARMFVGAKVPTIFPGPLVLWGWNEKAIKTAEAVERLSIAGGINIIPMPDYRPKYPKIDPEAEINPNHPNLTIWHNKIDVCMFIGVHCHYANLSLKIIRGGTACFTMAFCAEAGHEDANLSVRDMSPTKLDKVTEIVKKLKTNSKGF